jgi:cyclic pyranopterin phosphate synthase
MDPFGRTIDYLRISVTDRCNERCLYCMPEGYKGWAQKPDHLTASEIVRLAAAAARIGFKKFRLTGGEPLLRPDILEIASGIRELPGVKSVSMSTNAVRLAGIATALRAAGVESINISLDALDEAIYQRITGGKLAQVLDGIEAAKRVGFPSIKLNCVLMRGVNDSQILPLVRFAGEQNLSVRFIELMPLSRTDVLDEANFLPVGEVMQMLESHGCLAPLPDYRPGHGPAAYYEFSPGKVKIGFIGALTNPHFCESCNKLRLTADGKLRPCLGRHGEIDVREALRKGVDPTVLLRDAIANKPENHEFTENYQPGRPMTAIGG